ncbi:hypothetical protein MJO28_002136 [Puccinia striiformis f. sp. tritici]|uniref:Uncharacterized protein n=1 Tax=Puccinia striiformis f. sp. tritici TaxID=168172 RepID=A0ACC0EWA6_9BASI|nr:hypothetical protein Pst134EB_003755 [Puccinia striiformis f. sp. tritici]KAI7961647.1 hypothetical protein MJO28_002136 [Puccinia striiformis f. sp. tritici]KAI7966464.1 hypothetical protein MJO29_002212 [Puccinia striiformis f. sp. tritici]
MRLPDFCNSLIIFLNLTSLTRAISWRLLSAVRNKRGSSSVIHDPELYLPKRLKVEGKQVNWVRLHRKNTKILSCYLSGQRIWMVQNETHYPVGFSIRINGEEAVVFQNTIAPRATSVTGIPGSSILSLDVDFWGQVI